MRAIVFLRNERPIPPQDRVWRDDAGDSCKPTPAEDLAFHGNPTALVVGEAKPSASVRCAEDSVLLEQVVNDGLLLPVDPAGEEKNDEGERRRQRVHGASLPERLAPCNSRQIRPRTPSLWIEFRDTSVLRSRRMRRFVERFGPAEFSHRTRSGSSATAGAARPIARAKARWTSVVGIRLGVLDIGSDPQKSGDGAISLFS